MNKCQQVKQDYEQLKQLKQEFDAEFAAKNLPKVLELKAQLENLKGSLRETIWPFEALPQREFKKQYESQKEILLNIGILEALSTGELGITAIDGKEYSFPTYREIRKRMRESKEVLKTKTEQGFNQLLITPFGMKLEDLAEKYGEVILRHHQEGKLLATKEKTSDPDEPLGLDKNKPVWKWGGYKNADISGKLVYFPEKYDKINHSGQTKQDVINEQGGFTLTLIEDLPNIPRKGKGITKRNRKQPEAGLTPNKYLELLQTESTYNNETGFTPEEQIVYSIRHLEKTNQVINDVDGRGSVSYQLAAYFPEGHIPTARWYRVVRQADLNRSHPGAFFQYIGVRSAVRF